MSKISYENKIGIEPKTVHINQVQDVDMNEIKVVVNDNDECSVSSDYPILNDKTSAGRRFGSFDSPLSGDIILSSAGVQEGGCSCLVWEGSSPPLILGGNVITLVGEILTAGIYTIYFHYLNGGYNVNILGLATPPPPVDKPAQPHITNVSLDADIPPVQPNIIDVELDAQVPPEQPEITNVTLATIIPPEQPEITNII